MLILLIIIAFISAFINNTPVVVVLLPVVISLSKKMGIHSSKMLIPVSYASIFGGCCTLVGTSTNILASGIISNSVVYENMEPLGMFELTKIALPLLGISLAVIVLFGRKLLPEREALSNIISEIDQKEFLTEAVVQKDSKLLGKKITASGLNELSGVRLLEVVRNGITVSSNSDDSKFKENDRLVLSCKRQGIIETNEFDGIKLLDESSSLGLEQISSKSGEMVECLVGPASSLISKSLVDVGFRTRFNLTILAIHRRGKNLGKELDKVKFQPGDTLLILGTDDAIGRLRKSEEVVFLDHSPTPLLNMKKKAPIVIGVLIGIIGVAYLGILPISIASIIGV
jgi:di/tricarboxylate transporter